MPILDDRGTLVGVADDSGVIIEKLYYNSTGLIKSFDGDGVENLGLDGNNIGRSKYLPFGWTGMYKDRFTGLYHTHFREYDPVHGRWLSEDPAGYRDGYNLYAAYMGVNGVDALGLRADKLLDYADQTKDTFLVGGLNYVFYGTIWGALNLDTVLPQIGSDFMSGRALDRLKGVGHSFNKGVTKYSVGVVPLDKFNGGYQPTAEMKKGSESAGIGIEAFFVLDITKSLTKGIANKVIFGKWAGEAVYKPVTEFGPIVENTAQNAKSFEDIAFQATRNPNSKKLVLGHYSDTATTYQKVAAHYRATYFKIKNWNAVTKGLLRAEKWKINEAFLKQQLRQGKQIIFSHNPLKPKLNSFFEMEVQFLKDQGYRFVRDGWVWRAVK